MTNSKKTVRLSQIGFSFITASFLLFASGCAVPPHKQVTSGPTDEEIKAFIEHNKNIVNAARLNAASEVVRGVCETPTSTAQINCAALLRALFDKLKTTDIAALSGEQQAFYAMGKNLSERKGKTYGCTISTDTMGTQGITCTPMSAQGYIARADSGNTLYTSSIVKIRPNKIKKNKQPQHLTLRTLEVVGDVSHATFAFGAISPAQDKVAEASTESAPAAEATATTFAWPMFDMQEGSITPPLAATAQTPVVPPFAASPKDETLRVKIENTIASTDGAKQKGKLPLIAGAVAVVSALAAFKNKKAKRKAAPLTSLLATTWIRRRQLLSDLDKNKWSIAGGGLAGIATSKARIGAQFALAKMITIPAIAIASASLSSVLVTVGLTAATAIVAGAGIGAVAELIHEACSTENTKEKGWWTKALRKGLNSGAVAGLVGGAVADMCMSNGFLHEYVAKPVGKFIGAHTPVFSSLFNSIKHMFAGSDPLQQVQEATGMDVSSMPPVTAPEPVQTPLSQPIETIQTPPAPVEPQAAQLPPTVPEPEPVTTQPTVAAPTPEPVTQAAPSVSSNVPQLFSNIVPPDVYDVMSHDQAGQAIQRKMIEAAQHPSNVESLLSTYKEASYHLLNEVKSTEATRSAAKKLLEDGYKLATEHELLTRTGKKIARDLATVLIQEGGAENLKQAADALVHSDHQDKIVKGLLKTIKSVRPALLSSLAPKSMAPAL